MKAAYDLLVIDDEPLIADSISKVGLLEGLTVDRSTSVSEALRKIETCRHRLAICDVMMPETDGFGFLEALQEREIELPVVMTTGYSTIELAMRSFEKGSLCFIAKPFTTDELIAVIRRGLKFEQLLHGGLRTDGAKGTTVRRCPGGFFRLGVMSWVTLDTVGVATVGLTDLFLKTVDEMAEIELLHVNDLMTQGSVQAGITVRDGLIHRPLAPISGRIIDRNDALITDPGRLLKDPFETGYLYRVIPSCVDHDLKNLIPCRRHDERSVGFENID